MLSNFFTRKLFSYLAASVITLPTILHLRPLKIWSCHNFQNSCSESFARQVYLRQMSLTFPYVYVYHYFYFYVILLAGVFNSNLNNKFIVIKCIFPTNSTVVACMCFCHQIRRKWLAKITLDLGHLFNFLGDDNLSSIPLLSSIKEKFEKKLLNSFLLSLKHYPLHIFFFFF